MSSDPWPPLSACLASGRSTCRTPGSRRAGERFDALAARGRDDLVAARLAEGHVDASAIRAELSGAGYPEPGGRSCVNARWIHYGGTGRGVRWASSPTCSRSVATVVWRWMFRRCGDIARTGGRPGGRALGASVTDYPLTGEAVHAAIAARPGPSRVCRHEEEDFLMEVFARTPPPARSVARTEGLH